MGVRLAFDQGTIAVDDAVLDLVPCPELAADIELRPYQQEALDRWLSERQGVLVLPQGRGRRTSGSRRSTR